MKKITKIIEDLCFEIECLWDNYPKSWYYNIRNFFKRLFKIGPYLKFLLLEDFDWDYSYLLRLMEIKLRRMSYNIKYHGHAVGNEDRARELLVAAEMCKRIVEMDYTELAYKNFKKEFGKTRMISTPIPGRPCSSITFTHDNCKTEEDEKRADKETMRIAKQEAHLRQQDLNYLTDLMRRKMFRWWD